MTKKVDTWMPLLVDKYLGDTTHLTTEQHGAYLLLLMTMWKRDGVLPFNDQQLAAIARMTPAKWRASKDLLLEFFRPTEDGAGLTQKRLTEELQRSKEHTNRRAAAGAEGAKKRWQKDGNAIENDGKGDGNAIANGSQTAWQTGRSTPPPTPEEKSTGTTPHQAGVDLDGHKPTPAGAICRALRSAGIGDTNPGHPTLQVLLAAGATEAEFLGAVNASRDKGDPFAYLLGVVEGQRKRAAESAKGLHRGPMPAAPANDRKARQLETAALMTGAKRAAPQHEPETIDVDARLIAPRSLG